MRNTFLDFEQPLAELDGKIEQLRFVQADSAVDISDEISRLQQKSQTLAKEIYGKLTPWQTAMVARHPQRSGIELVHEGQGVPLESGSTLVGLLGGQPHVPSRRRIPRRQYA